MCRIFPPEIGAILNKLKAFFLGRSVPAFLVGGYIRDYLRGTPNKDIDVAVIGDPTSLAKALADTFGGVFVPLGQAHQVARVVVRPKDDVGWTVDVSGIEGSIYTDLARRDFTVDGMALALEDWDDSGWAESIIDPFSGKEDLSHGILRAIKPTVFGDDPARLLRAVRLAAKLGLSLEPHTARLIEQQAPLVSSIPGERARDELLTILSLTGAKVHLETLDELGLLCCIIPELGMTKGVEQPKEHYWDVFDHSIHSVEAVERVTPAQDTERNGDPVSSQVPWDLTMEEHFSQEISDGHTRRTILKLGALLHDIGKPQTKMVDAKGKTRFLGHHTLGASMSRDISRRLRLSNRGSDTICGLVKYHLRPLQMSQGGDPPTPRAIHRYFRDLDDVGIDTLYLSLADHLAARGPDLSMDGWQRHAELIAHILEIGTHKQSPEKMPRLITGHDLIQEFGLSPGPLIGILLEDLQDAQVMEEVSTRPEALAWTRRRLKDSALEGTSPKVHGS